MGRRAKPVDLILIQGTKHLTKMEIEARQEAEAKLRPNDDKVRPPNWLDDVARKEFKRLVKELKEVGLVTNVDVNALALYCDAYSNYVKCSQIIEEEGLMVEYTNKAAETNKVPHPLLTKKKQLHEQMKSLAVEFGLTPSSRAKLALPKEEPKQPTPFEQEFGEV